MAWYDPKKPSLRERLESLDRHKGKTKLNVDLGLEDLDVELDDIFESLGDTFDSLGDSFDSLLDDSGKSLYDMHDQYTGASKREREREKMRAGLAADRELMKVDLRAAKSQMRLEKEKMKADMKQMKKNLKKSLPRGTVNIQSGGDITTSNISVTGEEGVSISGSNGNLTMKIGNMRENTFKHKLKLTDHKNDTTTHIRYYDENNFMMSNDEFSGAFNVNDAAIKNIKHYIRTDIEGTRPPNTYSSMHELSPDLDIMAPPFDTEGDPFNEYDKPHQSLPPHTCEPRFVSRTWKGEKGKPIEFDEGARVTVSGHNAFGRKYEVKINGNAIYVPEIENLMDYCYSGDHLDTFLEMRSPAEKVVLLKIIDGLIAMKIAEPHHEGIKQLL